MSPLLEHALNFCGVHEVFRQKAATLAVGLEHNEQRDAARQALRGFLEKIVIPPGDGLLQMVGNFGAMLIAAQGRTASNPYAVANDGCGARNQHYLHLWRPAA